MNSTNIPQYVSIAPLDHELRLPRMLFEVNSIASIITVPIISALLAQAAVVYAQRRRKDQYLSVRQVFALADGGWSNLHVMKDAWPPWRSNSGHRGAASSHFLWLAAIFLLLCECVPARSSCLGTTCAAFPTCGSYEN